MVSETPPAAHAKEHAPVTVIQPISGFVAPNLAEVWEYRELIVLLALRDLASKYRNATLGIAWAIVQPLTMMAILTLVFGRLGKMPSEGVPYPLFSFAAMFLWQYFASAMTACINALATSGPLITKVYFPRLVLPLSAVISPLADLVVAFCALLVLMLLYHRVPSVEILFVPLFIGIAIMCALGAGLWLGTLHMQFRDLHHLIPLITQIWMFASPIIYPISLVPQEWRWLYELNPMAGAIEGVRASVLGTTTPELSSIALTSFASALILLLTGLIYFRQVEKDFADII